MFHVPMSSPQRIRMFGCFAAILPLSFDQLTRFLQVARPRRGAPSSLAGCAPEDAPESKVRHAGVDHLRLPRRRSITKAVIGRAQVRTSLDDFARNPKLRLARVVTLLRRDDARVDGAHAA